MSPGKYDVRFATSNPNAQINSKYALSSPKGESVIPSVKSGFITIESADKDGDGLLDTWEQDIIDADPDDNIRDIEDVKPEDDFDGDGDSNLTEYENGTDPMDPNDFAPDPNDTDRDCLPDDCEQMIVDKSDTLDSIEDVNPKDDFDGDGESNHLECANGTDPTDPADRTAYQPGDLNGDKKLTLADAIIALRITCGFGIGRNDILVLQAEVDGDGKIGLVEAVFILRKLGDE